MSRPYLTVLTTPIHSAPTRLYRRARSLARLVVRPGAPLPPPSPYPGHFAVVRSVVEGLREIHADFNFNPVSFGELARVVYAPANEALLQAASLKRSGAIDFLVAGPVNALFADECDRILQQPEIDRLIIPSEWTRSLYREVPSLAAKARVCPCGVDTGYWQPKGRLRSKTAVVYWKSGEERFCDEVEAIVRQRGLEPLRVRSGHGEHGIFTPADYRDALDRSAIAVFLSTFETQGLALAEAWAMDVPTIVWDPRGDAEWRGRRFASESSAPYLTPATGVAFRETCELKSALDRALDSPGSFQPRNWVLEHMTDAVCSRKLYDLIKGEAGA